MWAKDTVKVHRMQSAYHLCKPKHSICHIYRCRFKTHCPKKEQKMSRKCAMQKPSWASMASQNTSARLRLLRFTLSLLVPITRHHFSKWKIIAVISHLINNIRLTQLQQNQLSAKLILLLGQFNQRKSNLHTLLIYTSLQHTSSISTHLSKKLTFAHIQIMAIVHRASMHLHYELTVVYALSQPSQVHL